MLSHNTRNVRTCRFVHVFTGMGGNRKGMRFDHIHPLVYTIFSSTRPSPVGGCWAFFAFFDFFFLMDFVGLVSNGTANVCGSVWSVVPLARIGGVKVTLARPSSRRASNLAFASGDKHVYQLELSIFVLPSTPPLPAPVKRTAHGFEFGARNRSPNHSIKRETTNSDVFQCQCPGQPACGDRDRRR